MLQILVKYYCISEIFKFERCKCLKNHFDEIHYAKVIYQVPISEYFLYLYFMLKFLSINFIFVPVLNYLTRYLNVAVF